MAVEIARNGESRYAPLKNISQNATNRDTRQCDEAKPECKNCTTFGAQCDYVGGTETLQDAALDRSLFLNTQGPRTRGKRGRPRTRWNPEQLATASADGSSSSQTEAAPPALPASAPQSAGPDPSSKTPGYADEIQLLHHFLTREYEGSAGEPPTYDTLRLQAPKLGFAYPFVLHLVYEFAALDFARLQPPEKRQHYRSLAAHYSTLGLNGVTSMLSRLDEDNCHAVYTAAVFACINAFARGPQPGEYLLFSEHGPPQWLPLMRGVRTIVEMIGIEKIAGGPQGDRPVNPSPKASEPAATAWRLVQLVWIDHFDHLQGFVQASGGPNFAVNLKALFQLRMCYEAIHGGVDATYQGNADHQNLFIWTYQLEEGYTDLLQERNPVALIILAHFALLLRNFECIWFLRGWADHLINGVQKFLDQHHQVWLEWPIQQVEIIKEKERQCS